MRISRIVACLAAVTLLCACGGRSAGHPTSAPSKSSSATAAACPFTSDTVLPTGTVEIRPPRKPLQRITANSGLPCYTFLQVANSGKADATFVTQDSRTACELRQNTGSTSLAVLWTREPVAADYLFRLAAGHAACTFRLPLHRVNLCGIGTMSVLGSAQVTAQCNPDPSFQVAVLAGLVLVTVANAAGGTLLHSGQELTFSSASGQEPPGLAVFGADDMAVFTAQAKQQALAPAPQQVRFTSPAPASASQAGSYQVSAVGGVSGNPVVLTIDRASIKMCSISGIAETFTSAGAVTTGTVTYNVAGPCVIDANQASNALYQAAPQQQLSITSTAPPS